jgi:hypothetical protein
MTMRHDLLLGAWHRIAHRAWVATAVEPAMERLRAGTGRAATCWWCCQTKAWWSQTFLWSTLPPTAFSTGQHTRQVRQHPCGTPPSSTSTVEAGRWQAAPSLPSPWSPTGTWAGDAASTNPCRCCCLLCDGRVGRHHLLLRDWSSSKARRSLGQRE